MVKKILMSAGFIEGKTFKETRFLNPPSTTYAVYLDSFNRYGADNTNLLKEHNYTIELYSSTPNKDAETRLETVLDGLAIEYEKGSRYWIQEEQLYQVTYDFSYIEK